MDLASAVRSVCRNREDAGPASAKLRRTSAARLPATIPVRGKFLKKSAGKPKAATLEGATETSSSSSSKQGPIQKHMTFSALRKMSDAVLLVSTSRTKQ